MKAGALYYALFLGLIVLIICYTILLSSQFQKQYIADWSSKQLLRDNVISGIKFALKNNSFVRENSRFELFENTGDTIAVRFQAWGVFENCQVTAFHNTDSVSRVFLIGKYIPDLWLTALFKLNIKNGIVNVCGNSQIIGGSNLRGEQFKRSSIEGFASNSDVQTTITNSKPADFDDCLYTTLDFLKSLSYKSNSEEDNMILNNGDIIKRSFFEPTLIIYKVENIDLSYKSISGNVIIASSKTIFVSKTTYLKDVILFSPDIQVEDDFIGTAQLFSNSSIQIGKNCTLNYPSVVCVVKEQGIQSDSIQIGDDSRLYGCALMIKPQNPTSNESNKGIINLNEGTLINGWVYSESEVQLNKSTIYGQLICSNFKLTTRQSVYKDFMLNSTVNSSILNKYFLGPTVFKGEGELRVIDSLE